MSGYQLDGPDNTTVIGTSVFNVVDKQPTTSDFLGTVRVVDLPLDASAVIYPGGLYVPDVVPAYVQGNSFAGGGTPVGTQALAFGSSVGAAALIVVAVGWVQSGGPSSCTITDSQGNTYSPFPSGGPYLLSNIGYLLQVFYTVASAGALTVTFTAGGTGTPTAPFCRFLIHEYKNASSVTDGSQTQNINAPTNPFTDTVTTTSPNDLLFAWAVDNNGILGYTAPATLRQTAGAESTGDVIAGTPGSNSISCTVGQQGGGMIAVAFKAAAGPTTVNATGTGDFQFAGSGTATITVNPTGTGAITFGGSGTAVSFGPATGAGAITFGASGTVASVGPVSGTGAIVFAASGTAGVTVQGVGTGAITFAGAGTATVTVTPTGTGAITFAGSGTGTVTTPTGGTGAIVFGGSGTATASGGPLSGTGAISFGGAGTATVTVFSSGTGAISFGASGLASVVLVGVGSGAISFAGSGTAQIVMMGVGTGAIVFSGAGTATWTGGTGVPAPPLTATVALRPIPLLTVPLPSTGLVAVSQQTVAGVTVALEQIPVIAVPLP